MNRLTNMVVRKLAMRNASRLLYGTSVAMVLTGCQPNPCEQPETFSRVAFVIPAIISRTGNLAETVDRKISQCSYSYSDHVVTTEMELDWHGPMTGADYAMKGRLRLADDGTWEWSTIGVNENLRDWYVAMGLLGAAFATISN